jgi:hypothetical protein
MNNEKKITINPLPYSPFGGRGALKKIIMKKLSLFFLLLLLATSCASIGTTNKTAAGAATAPVYYTGNDEPATSGMFVYSDEN